MADIGKILVLIESHQQASHLLDKALLLARTTGARLEVFTSCYCQSLTASYPFDEEAREHAKLGYLHGIEKWLDELIQPLLDQGLEVASDLYWERHQEQAMMTKIGRYEPDLVIKDCRYHHRIDQYIFGHVDWELIRHVKVPLLLVRPGDWSATPKVVAAVDPVHSHDKGPALDMVILAMARQFSDWLGGHLCVFHSFQPLPMSVILDDTLVLDYQQFRNRLRRTHQQSMEVLLDQFGLPADQIETYLAEGEPHLVLPDYATEHGVDIVVLGAVERNLMDRFFIGSTSEMALDHLPCDLLVVKESQAAASLSD